MPTGELPRNILMTVDRSMVGTIAPGTRVTAVAIYSTVQVGPMSHASKSLLCMPAMHALHDRHHYAWHTLATAVANGSIPQFLPTKLCPKLFDMHACCIMYT